MAAQSFIGTECKAFSAELSIYSISTRGVVLLFILCLFASSITRDPQIYPTIWQEQIYWNTFMFPDERIFWHFLSSHTSSVNILLCSNNLIPKKQQLKFLHQHLNYKRVPFTSTPTVETSRHLMG